MKAVLLLTMVSSLLIGGLGCGRESVEDTEPFRLAISSYLEAQQMGMTVDEFKDIEVEGDTATASVAMAHAEGATGIKVRWRFTFRKQAGRWTVTACER